MGYFEKGVGDPRFWVIFVGLPFIVTLNLADLFTATLAPPGIFNFWVMRITVVGGFLVALFIATRNSKKLRARRLEAARQKNFESRRLEELRRRVAVEPEFQTLCFRCRHFDAEKITCKLEIFNLAARRVRLDTPVQYCLYYEATGEDSP